ncbi:hypothetical protein [Streptomyces flavidovirens]|uniref:Uncharacterized protein n=1 Tax=Streptomyces flavidovirens TaxID=67298 RepID=A0ABW6R8F1_9ACTN
MTQRVGNLSPELAERLDSAAAETQIDVIVELRPLAISTAGSKKDRIAAAQEAFARELHTLADVVEDLNGHVVDSAWLNQTARVVMPARAVEELAAAPDVVRVTLPRHMEPESV